MTEDNNQKNLRIQHAYLLSLLPEMDEIETPETSSPPSMMSLYVTEHFRLTKMKNRTQDTTLVHNPSTPQSNSDHFKISQI